MFKYEFLKMCFYFMCMVVLPSYMSAHHVHAWYRGQEKTPDLLGLELKTSVSHHVGPGD